MLKKKDISAELKARFGYALVVPIEHHLSAWKYWCVTPEGRIELFNRNLHAPIAFIEPEQIKEILKVMRP